MLELEEGTYSGVCFYPEGTDLSQSTMCKDGLDLLGGACTGATAQGLDAASFCSFYTRYGAGVVDSCTVGLSLVQLVCTGLQGLGTETSLAPFSQNPVLRDSICRPPPSSVSMFAEIVDAYAETQVYGTEVIVPRTAVGSAVVFPIYTIKTTTCTSNEPRSTPTPDPPGLQVGALACQAIPYSIYDALDAANTYYGLESGVVDWAHSLSDCCYACRGNCAGFTWDGGQCVIVVQLTSDDGERFSPYLEVGWCFEGVYPIAVPKHPEDTYGEQWFTGYCVGQSNNM